MNIIGMSEQWVMARIQQKGEGKCIPWVSLRDLIVVYPDIKRKVDIFALCIYGLVIFPKALRHVDEPVIYLFDRLEKGVTQVPASLAETFRSLNACRRAGEDYSPLKELVIVPRRDDISEENWITLLQYLQENDFEWRTPWFIPDEILYQCGSYNWGVVGYAPLLVLRQYKSRQSIPATHWLAQFEFSYRGKNYKKKVREIADAWKQIYRMKRVDVGQMITLEYNAWRKLGKKIEQLEEEKIHLKLDIDIQKSEAEKLKKGKKKAEEDLDSLKTDYKKLHLSMRTVGLGKTSEQWRQEIQEGKAKVDQWEKRFHEA
ncbi:myosin heavy chain-like [Gossypium australe]|uniref:Myosin heavy chain-like n=1 Tax=Gossypium australe TaxID=47621 RepID=A0A5B6V7G8_9ROSI|nr:myosin heavy chain-like [Gossypium australe]